MAFRFSLATLLRLREIAEQREERLLGQIQNQLLQNRQTLSELDTQRRSLIARREQASQQLMPAGELIGFYERIRSIEELERRGREELAKLESLRTHQMKIYEAAHRNRELLSGMREEKREEFLREQDRREQSLMDDNFSSRRNFR